MRIAISWLLERPPDIRLEGEVVQSGLVGGALMTIQSLPVAFPPEVS